MVLATTSLYFLAGQRVFGLMSRPSCSRFEALHYRGMRMFATAANAVDEAQLVQDMLSRVRSINQMPDDVRANVMDFVVDGVKLGKV